MGGWGLEGVSPRSHLSFRGRQWHLHSPATSKGEKWLSARPSSPLILRDQGTSVSVVAIAPPLRLSMPYIFAGDFGGGRVDAGEASLILDLSFPSFRKN
ncbi:hypothetical protein CRG98_011052 [Punica granatum]|uniref:Uncharacterized protein n=1 Tax=Punica granatum TaxID=22663 RepID=A0A2I0KL77_PUNGR|nr:hypothetical protein CRG98_011052 [Punica granatum]